MRRIFEEMKAASQLHHTFHASLAKYTGGGTYKTIDSTHTSKSVPTFFLFSSSTTAFTGISMIPRERYNENITLITHFIFPAPCLCSLLSYEYYYDHVKHCHVSTSTRKRKKRALCLQSRFVGLLPTYVRVRVLLTCFQDIFTKSTPKQQSRYSS